MTNGERLAGAGTRGGHLYGSVQVIVTPHLKPGTVYKMGGVGYLVSPEDYVVIKFGYRPLYSKYTLGERERRRYGRSR